jgi:2-oxoisovalerate dehydrogenase E1 component alpha subunit
MLLTRIIENHARKLYMWNSIESTASCRGHEAAQVGSAVCIEVETDFTLPYYRDLGVVLTIGMTPYEIFRTYLQAHGRGSRTQDGDRHTQQSLSTSSSIQHWGYNKHNTIAGPTPVATQLLHAAGIAFASKLRKASAVTIAYCGDEIVAEPDFLESLRFAAQHRLPALFICEQDCSHSRLDPSLVPSCFQKTELPAQLFHQRLDGTDVVAVYTATQAAIQNARAGCGPTLLEMYVTRQLPDVHVPQIKHEQSAVRSVSVPFTSLQRGDPLMRCQRYLEEQGVWDEAWAAQLALRLETEVEQALQNALRDTLQLPL